VSQASENDGGRQPARVPGEPNCVPGTVYVWFGSQASASWSDGKSWLDGQAPGGETVEFVAENVVEWQWGSVGQ
jgi:hypothetical protein